MKKKFNLYIFIQAFFPSIPAVPIFCNEQRAKQHTQKIKYAHIPFILKKHTKKIVQNEEENEKAAASN